MKLIIFADYGLDDAAATATVFENAHRFSKIDIVPIGGNVPAEVAFKNCLTLIYHLKSDFKNLRIIDTRDIPQPSEYLAEIHGMDGMGDIFTAPKAPPDIEILPFEDWLLGLNGSETVLSLGPATLVKRVMERHTHPLILMGGVVNEAPNFKGYEFNEALDTEAFFYCLKFPHIAITLDTCRTPALV